MFISYPQFLGVIDQLTGNRLNAYYRLHHSHQYAAFYGNQQPINDSHNLGICRTKMVQDVCQTLQHQTALRQQESLQLLDGRIFIKSPRNYFRNPRNNYFEGDHKHKHMCYIHFLLMFVTRFRKIIRLGAVLRIHNFPMLGSCIRTGVDRPKHITNCYVRWS